jgi:hypothetical protein
VTRRKRRLLEILETRLSPCLPAEARARAYRVARLLEAARSWDDVDVITKVAEWRPGVYVAPISGKWFIAFRWAATLGAHEMELVRI